jgi:phosphomannomutase/phosphoglucomutase
MNIFREYDIRGIYGKELNRDSVRRIGYALAGKIKGEYVAVGYDARLHSRELFEYLAEGFNAGDKTVLDMGMVPTPVNYFSNYRKIREMNPEYIDLDTEPDASVMITGSHNPPEYNGFKITIKRKPFFGEEIYALGMEVGKLEVPHNISRKVIPVNVRSIYIDYMAEQFAHLKGMEASVVYDCGNGVAGTVVPEIFRRLEIRAQGLYVEPDGTFPNHHPDPTVEKNLNFLKDTVLAKNAVMGVGYDGDADRIGAIDENGKIIWGDQLLILYARDILEENKNAKIIGEVKCSQTLYDDVKKHGGIPIMWKTGHSLIKNKLKQENAAVAGEMSGHIFFADKYFGYDDAIYATLRLVEIIFKKKVKLSKLLADLPKTFVTEEIRIDCPENKKFKIPDILKEELYKKEELKDEITDIVTIDGIRVIFKDGWGLVRASNTQPVLVLRFEGSTIEKRDFYKTTIEKILKKLL